MSVITEKYLLNSGDLFAGLPLAELRKIAAVWEFGSEKKQILITEEGTSPRAVFLLRKGKVKIFQVSPEGREQIAYIYGPGDLIGHRPLLSRGRHPVSAQSLEDCDFYSFKAETFLELLETCPVFSRRMLESLAREFSVWMNLLLALTQKPVKERVALILMILYHKFGKEIHPPALQFSRENLANFARTTPETFVRMLRQFKDEQVVETRGRTIEILQPEALERVAAEG